MTPCPESASLQRAVASLGDEHAGRRAPFRWFSELVDDAIAKGGQTALDDLRDLIEEAEADKLAGYGPCQDDINRARRRWLDLYEQIYGRKVA